MDKADKQRSQNIPNEIHDFVLGISSKKPKETQDQIRGVMLGQIAERRRLINKHFRSEEALEEYIQQHKYSELIRKRIKTTVAMKKATIERLATQGKEQSISKASDVAKFQMLVRFNYVEPSHVLPDIPEPVTLCGIKALVDWFKKMFAQSNDLSDEERALLEAIVEEWQSKLESIQNRWQAITGKTLNWNQLPSLRDLIEHKAPVPCRPAWTRELCSLEAKKMGHDPASNPESRDQLPGAVNSRREPIHPKQTAVIPEDSNEEAEGGGTAESDQAVASASCDMDTLFELAGARKLKQPGPDDKLYTFPGAKLDPETDVFYDYSLIIPVEDCGPYANEIEGLTSRSLVAAKILVGKVKTVLQFLRDTNLSNVFGFYGQQKVVDDIDGLMNDVLNLQAASEVTDVRKLHRRLREMAGISRLVSRTQMFLVQIGSDNPRDYLEALKTAVDQFPQFDQTTTNMPTDNNDGERRQTLLFPNDVFVPDAVLHDPRFGATYWHWRYDEEQKITLRSYVEWLGGTFKEKLDALFNASRRMKNAVEGFSGSYEQFRRDFEKLAAGLVNDAAAAISLLLDQIAEQLPLLKETTDEGSKRLALQVVFRQHWYPDGYVMGKLVGYKNLIPNQKENLKRRTFVKTTRETTTAEEFTKAREEDYSHSKKETAEVITEMAMAFNFSTNASGHFNIGLGGIDASVETGLKLSEMSKSTQSMVSEAAFKSSVKYSEKREVKIRELTEVEDVQEVTSELQNANQEITANYFYYQLLRQYRVTVELHDLVPILLRTRDVPTPAEIDDHFISKHIHILMHCLPAQLSVDAQAVVDELDLLGKTLIQRRADADQRAAELANLRAETLPTDEQELQRRREEIQSRERILADARIAYITAEEQYTRASMRMNRVVSHVRDNICYYMQFIWQASPKVDQDRLLQLETFGGQPLPRVTRGLMRQGYFGNEEIFEYTGQSTALFDLIINNLTPGSELTSLPEDELRKTTLFQYLERYYPEEAQTLIDQIGSSAFVTDPANPEEVLSTRSVQIAQDALVVETMPGQVPLLEGFQMAHRMLNVQKTCLENVHLAERIVDRPWNKEGDDTYAVRRYDGAGPEKTEVHEE